MNGVTDGFWQGLPYVGVWDGSVWDGANDSPCQPINCCGRVSLRICCGCHRVWAEGPASKPSLMSSPTQLMAVVPTSSLKHDDEHQRQVCAAVAADCGKRVSDRAPPPPINIIFHSAAPTRTASSVG